MLPVLKIALYIPKIQFNCVFLCMFCYTWDILGSKSSICSKPWSSICSLFQDTFVIPLAVLPRVAVTSLIPSCPSEPGTLSIFVISRSLSSPFALFISNF